MYINISLYIHVYIMLHIYMYACSMYVYTIICGQQLLHSFRARQENSDQMKISKDQSVQTAVRARSVARHLWLHPSINGKLDLV